jgi:DNA-binding NarL/FixJ family response regulator
MIVDDHSAMRRTLRSIIDSFSSLQNNYLDCESGEEAIQRYAQFQPECVLMDIQLQTMNGFTAAEKIYLIDPKASIIFVTSHDTPMFRNKAREIHARGFISKENLSELNQVIQSLTH